MTYEPDRESDWAASVLAVAMLDTYDLNCLAKAAGLSAESGDMVDIDLSNLDLRGQDFSGWDLRFAVFRNALVSGAKFKNAKINAESIIEANDWIKAELPRNIVAQARFYELRRKPISSVRALNPIKQILQENFINDMEDIFKSSTGELSRRLNKKTMTVLKNHLLKLRVITVKFAPYDSEQEEETKLREEHGEKFAMVIDEIDGDVSIHDATQSYMSLLHPIEKIFSRNRGAAGDMTNVDVVMVTMKAGSSWD